MTINDVLHIVVNRLSGIQVPATLVEQIGMPVSESIHNLNECIQVLDEAEKKAEESKPQEEGRQDG